MPLAELTLELDGGSALDSEAQRAGLILLGSLLLSFGFIRFSTRMIRAEVSWWPGNVTPGGLHIHHLVFGIVLLLLAGFLQFAFQPESPWLEILAALFDIGAGLTLDEFALWLYLEDVYWAEEGRRSVDAVILAVNQHRPVADRADAALEPRHLHQPLRSHPPALLADPRGAGARLQARQVQLQRQGGPV